MKKIIILFVFCLAICSFAFAQSPLAELDKVKQIKLLESTREDVKKIFGDDKEDSDGDSYSTENITIRISYSNGDCSDDSNEEWNVTEGKVTQVFVNLDDSVKPKDLKIDLSKLERLKRGDDEEDEDDEYIYYDKEKGTSYEISEGKISYMKFIPPETNYPALCNNENIRQFKSDNEWFRNKIKDGWICYFPRPNADVTEVTLSKDEITASCTTPDSPKAIVCSEDAGIAIETKAENLDNSVLLYQYTVSGGKLIGNGATVIWDLSSIKAGTYTITAAVDNGCGFCGQTKTKTVVVRDCPECSQKEK